MGDSFDVFENTRVYRNSVAMGIAQVGELAGKLSQEFRSNNLDAPWQKMKHMRNAIAHEYYHMEPPELWEYAVEHMPELMAYCQKVLVKMERQDKGD